MKNQTNHPPSHVGLMLALVGLISAATLLFGPTTPASAQATAPSWSYTGNLNAYHQNHTATLLQDGRVLVEGGYGVGGALNSAELYDPAKGSWSITGSLNTARDKPTATLLLNGKVLVVGGYGASSSLNSAELYDPATGSWSITGNLHVARAEHTATLLLSGKVLVAGGNFGPNSNSAELYDPNSGRWSITGSLNTTREGYAHTATLLSSGKVLVAGGFNNTNFYLTSAELYDPDMGTWSVTGSLNDARYVHSATLLSSGKVLVAGGCHCNALIDPDRLSTAELYDPATGTWSLTGDLNAPRAGHTTIRLADGRVLIAGGGDFGRSLLSTELYDPGTGTWSIAGELNAERYFHTATLLLDGKVLVAGGAPGGNTAELYDLGTTSPPNQIDDTQFFVRQHYRDFLSREPDSDGLAFWTNQITSCGGDQACIEVNRINDSGSFFLSIEFQETGYLAYRLYKTAFGDLSNAPVPITFSEFIPDTQAIGRDVIVKQSGWEQVLENNKRVFTMQFVERPRFTTAFPPAMSPQEFVDKLNANAGSPLSQTERDQLVSDLSGGSRSRAEVLRAIAENPNLAQAEFTRAFVLMQYFGYLRRNPNDAPDGNFAGYTVWLDKLNRFNGDFMQAEMVKAFLSSTEYRQRFGQ